MLYQYNKQLYQEKELNTSKEPRKVIHIALLFATNYSNIEYFVALLFVTNYSNMNILLCCDKGYLIRKWA